MFISDKINEYLFYNDQAYNRTTGFFENLTQEQIDVTRRREKDLVRINGAVRLKTIYSMLLGQTGNKIYWEMKKRQQIRKPLKNDRHLCLL
ncbi:hypothetical protein EJ377_14085 [Chryseobacterium arthrosphaerae]|uniref:Uncharacterized protein n=1 Tax=Chryseobacterium arthrosphaerae TaxID=651561 RepID=A0A432DRW0_9FLAO|nr:hypothetical protein EJ377_14085 [Chryseobacterium arthrosphaerae]